MLSVFAIAVLAINWGLERRDTAHAELVATASDTSSASDPSSAPSTSAPPTDLNAVAAQFTLAAKVTHPTGVAQRPGTDDLYVTGLEGSLVRAPRAGGPVTVVADLSTQVTTNGESGLLDLAFSNDGSLLYLSMVTTNGDLALIEYPFDGGGIAVDRARLLLILESPSIVHHAGDVDVDVKGLLWFSVGDGGPSQELSRRTQDLQDLHGKILRIDPHPSGSAPYTIPSDNPFVGRADARPEIWAYGLRNPWRFDVDPASGDLWIGDVGRNGPEEVDYDPAPRGGAGANFGWPYFEGDAKRVDGPPPGLVPPVISYAHGDRCSVTGGSVYRGSAIAGLAGAYLYSDLCDGFVRAVAVANGTISAQRTFDNLHAGYATSFGVDLAGELYVCSFEDDAVYLIAPA